MVKKCSKRRKISIILLVVLLMNLVPVNAFFGGGNPSPLYIGASGEAAVEPQKTLAATIEPTIETTVEPTAEPTAEPTVEPTVELTVEPTAAPTAEPTVEPTVELTVEPTAAPTAEPSAEPTVEPTAEPTAVPIDEATPDSPDDSPIAKGYAFILQDATPVLEKISPDNRLLAYLSKGDAVYVSKRIAVDADHSDNDWLLCHFDTSQGIQEGYIRAKYLCFASGSESDRLVQDIEKTGNNSRYEGHLLMLLDCEIWSATPDPTIAPTPEPTPEPTVEPTVEPTIEPTVEATTIPVGAVEPMATPELPGPSLQPSGDPLPQDQHGLPERDGLFEYRVGITDGYAIITKCLDKDATSLVIPYSLGGVNVVGIEDGALSEMTALREIKFHGNIRQIGERLLDGLSGISIKAYNGAEALRFAKSHGIPFTNLSTTPEREFADGLIDFSDVPTGRYAFRNDTDIRLVALEATRLSVGQVYYLPESAKYPLGNAFEVQSLENQGDWVIVHARVIEGVRVVKRVRYTGDLMPDWDRAIWYDGVEPVNAITSKAAGSVSLGYSKSIQMEKGAFKYEGTISIEGTLDYDIELSKLNELKVNKFKVVVEDSMSVTGRIEAKCTKKIPLGRVPLTSLLAPASVYVELVLEFTAEASGEVTIKLGKKYGCEWSNAYKKFLPVREERDPFMTANVKGSVSLMLRAAIGIDVKFLKEEVMEASMAGGVELNAAFSSKKPHCMDAVVKFVGDIQVEVDIYDFFFKANLWEAEWELWKWHFEWDGSGIHRVPKCTYGEDYTVSFVTLTSQLISSQTVADGECAAAPTPPTLPGNTFLGWYVEPAYEHQWVFTDAVHGDMTLYAKWVYNGQPGGGGGAGDVTYVVYRSGAMVTGYTGNPTYLNISETMPYYEWDEDTGGYVLDHYVPVTRISDHAFDGCTGLTSVTIPGSVTSIGGWVFNGCTSLKSVTIPNGVKQIWGATFRGCTSLTHVTLPNNLLIIDSNAFAGCERLTSVAIPSGVTSIGTVAFWNCYSLTSVTIPGSVTSIGESAFNSCSSLKSVIIQNGVKSIGDYAFLWCSSLTSVTVPGSVTSIGSHAFGGCTSLTSVTIQNGVKSIGGEAFGGCTSLTSITIPGSVTSIGSHALRGCASLTSVTIQNGVKSIEEDAFGECSSLTSITIPNSVTSIGNWAFGGCTSLASVNIPNSVTSIGEGTFSECPSLTSVTIPDSVTNIGKLAFWNCYSLTSVTIPGSVTGIGESAFNGCGDLTSVTIPDSVTRIGEHAFSVCTSLTSITIPNSVTSIGTCAFWGCTGLASVTIQNGVTSIGDGAFGNCTSLTSVTIPKSVMSIGDWTFASCTGMTIYGYTDSYAQSYATSHNIPFIALDAKTHIVFFQTNCATAIESARVKADEKLTAPVNPDNSGYAFTGWYRDAALTALWNFSTDTMPDSDLTLYAGWLENPDYFLRYTMSGECAALTAYTGPLTELTLPETLGGYPLTAIAADAFQGTPQLTRLTLSESIVAIAPGAFEGLDALYEVNVAAGNPYFKVEGGLLYNAAKTRLLLCPAARPCTSYAAPATLTAIDDYAFAGHEELSQLTLSNGLAAIGARAFQNCSALTSVNIPDSVTTIGDGTFAGCFWLKLYGGVGDCAAKRYAEANLVTYNRYRVEYYDGAELIYYVTATAGELLTDEFKPTKGALRGNGWYKDSAMTSLWNFEADCMPAATLKLYARWVSDFVVSEPGGGTLTVTGYTGTDGDIAVPEVLGGKNITAIANGAFVSTAQRPIYFLEIPDSVTFIASGAIGGTPKMTVIANPGTAAASYAQNAGNNVSFELKKYTVTWDVSGGAKLAPALVPAGQTLTLPTPVRDNYHFTGWYADKALTTAWTSVMPRADITLYAGWAKINENIEDPAYDYEYKADGSIVLTGYNGAADVIELPSMINGVSVTEIGDYAFYQNNLIQSVSVPDSVTRIGAFAFRESTLRKVDTGENVTEIGGYAFADCAGLYDVKLGGKLNKVETGAFYNCKSLLSIALPEGIQTIGKRAFSNCAFMGQVEFPAGLTAIEEDAFLRCSSLKALVLPDGLTAIGDSAFASNKLGSVLIPRSVISIGDNAFDTDLELIIKGYQGSVAQTYADSHGFEFKDVESFVKSIVLSESSKTLKPGDHFTLVASVLPMDAADPRISWSSNASCVQVSDTGEVTALGLGSATITATAVDGSGTSATCTVIVRQPVTGVTLDMTTATLHKGRTLMMTATVSPSNATDKSVTWSSSNTSIATVNSSGVVTGVQLGIATITATANDGSGIKATCTVTVVQPVTGITLSKTSETIIIGQVLSLSAAVAPNNATNKSVTWSSSNTAVATVSAAGVVTGLRLGTATITVTAKDGSGIKATCTVTVGQPVSSITMNLPKITIGVGQAVSTVTAAVLPSNAVNKKITWSSSNSAIAKVDASGKITGVKAGTATITAAAADGSRKTASVVVTVVSAGRGVTGIKLSLSSATVYVKKTLTLKATLTPAVVSDPTVQWSSSNKAVAMVNKGVVTGVAPGRAIITAISSSGYMAKCTITVTDVPVSSVTMSKTSVTVLIGSTFQLTATVLPSDAKNKTLTWVSSNASVAAVDAAGKVTAKALGTATITASSINGKTAACKVMVNPVKIVKLSLTPASTSITIGKGEVLGKKTMLKANITPANATIRKLKWSTSNSKVATVDTNGIFTSVGNGTAIITAAAQDGSGKKASCTVTVTVIKVTSLKLAGSSTMVVGGTQKLTATASPTNAQNSSVAWTSSNSKIVIVDAQGNITAVAKGIVTITATARDGSGKKATFKITVK